MKYTHINDCWEAIRNARSLEEIKDLFDDFPRWSGDWYYEITTDFFGEKTCIVYNEYDDETGHQQDSEEVDVYIGNDKEF